MNDPSPRPPPPESIGASSAPARHQPEEGPGISWAVDLLDTLEFAVQGARPLSFDPDAMRSRLARRAAASVRASRAMVTVRHAAATMARATEYARLQTLYLAADGALRPGEPLHVLLIELAPDGHLMLAAPVAGVQREWLLLRGRATLGGAAETVTLDALDFHVVPAAGRAAGGDDAAHHPAAPTRMYAIRADAHGALLFLRESLQPAEPGEQPRTVRDAVTPWKPYAPLVERRVLWRRGPLASLLYRAAPGASVPQHAHGHDEECLVLRGQTFQDDCLLREGDYQLAPAGSGHVSGSTDVGAIFYIHGDFNLDLTPPAAAAAPAA